MIVPYPRQCPAAPLLSLLSFLLLLIVSVSGCGDPEPGGPGRTAGSRAGLDEGPMPPARIEFDSLAHDFGPIDAEAEPVTHVFTFRNTGQSLLFIRDVKSS